MTLLPDGTLPHFGLVAGSVLLLCLRSQAENATVIKGSIRSNGTNDNSADVVAIVVPTVVVGLLLVTIGVLVYLFLVVRKKRQTEGTYRPSAEEQSGARSVAMPDALKLPKEERLI